MSNVYYKMYSMQMKCITCTTIKWTVPVKTEVTQSFINQVIIYSIVTAMLQY